VNRACVLDRLLSSVLVGKQKLPEPSNGCRIDGTEMGTLLLQPDTRFIMSMTPSLRIHLLGEFRLFVADQPMLTIDRPRQQALLAYLLLHRHAPQPRQQVAFCFWPDSSEAQAYTNLRKLVFQVRQALPQADHFLIVDSQHLGWQANAPYTLDVAELEQALTELEHSNVPAAKTVQQVIALYRGELLPTCYDDWLLPLRRALHERVVNTLEKVVVGLQAQRAYELALRCAEHLRRLDPLHEASYRQLMQLRALSGDRAGALRVYHECVTVLEQELGVPPASETQALYEHLLKVEPTSAPASAAPALPTIQIPLVGRQPEWQALRQAWTEMSRGPRLVTIWGEAGVGKTRLVEELVHWARSRPGSVAYARTYTAEGALAYAPLTEWLRSEALRPVLAQAEKVWLLELARLLPELQRQHPNLPAPLPMGEGWQRQRFYEALARVILAAPPPLLLVLDDLHWCDAETLAWLRYLLRFDPQAHLLVVGTVRSEAIDEQHPLHELQQQLQRAGQYQALELAPLNVEEASLLASYLTDADITGWTARLYRETEGNPLFVVEMVRAGILGRQTTALPPTVQAVIAARLSQLSPVAHQLAQLAATVGQAFTLDVLAAASELDEDALVQGVDELWRRRVVREQEDSYEFSHDKIREVAYGEISPIRRRYLHQRVAQALERLYTPNLETLYGRLGLHFERAGMRGKAVAYLQQAGEQAQRLSANQEALRYYHQALVLAQENRASLPADQQVNEAVYHHILALRAQVYLALYQGKEAVADFQQLLTRARQSGNREQELEFLLGLVNAYYLVALDDQATDAALKLRELYATTRVVARDLGNKRQLILSLLLPIWHFWPEERDQAMTDSREAFALSCELGDEELMIESRLALLYNAHEQEQAEVGDALLESLQARRDLDRLNRASFYLMWTHYHLGNFRRVVTLCDAGIELATRIGVLPVQYPTLKAFALLSLGQYGDAWESLQQEIADDAHVLGCAFQSTGVGMYLFEVAAFTQAAAVLEQVFVQAERLRRGWLCEWVRLRLVRSLLRAGQAGQCDWTRAKQLLAAANQKVLQGLKPWQAHWLVVQAEMAVAEGQLEEALRQLEAASALTSANGYRAELASAWELQARVLLQLQRPTEALARLDEALPLSLESCSRPLTWRIYATKAQTLEVLRQTEAAAQAWQTAATLIQASAVTIHDREQQQGFLSDPFIASIVTRAHNQCSDQGGR
jgi:DNA-binding SARP family transcriptional activator/tetratricopeptide (TPR) repeat protein